MCVGGGGECVRVVCVCVRERAFTENNVFVSEATDWHKLRQIHLENIIRNLLGRNIDICV